MSASPVPRQGARTTPATQPSAQIQLILDRLEALDSKVESGFTEVWRELKRQGTSLKSVVTVVHPLAQELLGSSEQYPDRRPGGIRP